MTDTKMCPYCGEEVKLGAIKCKFCHSFLDRKEEPRVTTPVKPNLIGCFGIMGAVVVFFIGYFYVTTLFDAPTSSPPKPSPTVSVEPAREPIVVTVDVLISDLKDNALKAANTYKDQYVELTGTLSNIDSDGSYFSLGLLSGKFSFDTVLCRIEDHHLDAVMNFSNGQEVTVTGKIISVGDILGYTLQVDTIK